MGGEGLPDDCRVIRGGRMDLDALVASLHLAESAGAGWTLSFWGEPGASTLEVLDLAEIPHGVVRLSTAGRLREAGFSVQPSPPPRGHLDVRWTRLPSEMDLRRLVRCFGEPIPNPLRGGLES